MKRFFCLILSLAFAACAFGQTAEEIVARMDENMAQYDEKDGVSLVMDIKMPIIGTFSTKAYTRGEKTRMEMSKAGAEFIVWKDGDTEYTYDVTKKEIEIKNSSPAKDSSDGGDVEMFNSITDGYDVSIKKETPTAWYITCKKSRSNTEKDDPKTMDLVVAKGTYDALSLSMKKSGITITLRDLKYGVTEKQVTFNPADYPDATIIDKRQ